MSGRAVRHRDKSRLECPRTAPGAAAQRFAMPDHVPPRPSIPILARPSRPLAARPRRPPTPRERHAGHPDGLRLL
jgi:hypothetical protein